MPYLVDDRRALDQRQQVALHALARHVGAVHLLPARDLVDLVEEDDAVLLDGGERLGLDLVVVEELARPPRRSAASSPRRPSSSSACAAPPPICWNMPWIWLVRSSMPGGAMISICGGSSETSISTSLSSSLPSRSILRNFCRVAESAGCMSWKFTSRAGGSSTSRTRSSAASAARSRTLRVSASRVCLIAASTRSRMMVSTSRPT